MSFDRPRMKKRLERKKKRLWQSKERLQRRFEKKICIQKAVAAKKAM